jgi:hypothetical protein
MKRVTLIQFLVISLFISPLSAQSKQLICQSKTVLTLEGGYSDKNFALLSFNFIWNKFLVGLSSDYLTETGEAGELYTTINWSQNPEDRLSSGSYKTAPTTIQVGYNVIDNLYLGVGVGFGTATNYRNMYDKFHILGNDGYYSIQSKGEDFTQIKYFANYFIPLDKTIYATVNAQYATVSGIGIGVGIGMEIGR